ncbi:phosphopantetheine-binding protein, partial [Streptomyces sp. NPDC057757]|uniref:phosphopantetheine-binding protein n=1 Tax=Streptomyces sp. NPDC057757 TaxID=3346241 RepID=UPI0036748FD8
APAPAGAGFTVDSTSVPGGEVEVTALIEARLPEVDIRTTEDPLVRNLVDRRACRPYLIPTGTDGHVETGGLTVTERPYRLVDAAGRVHPYRYAFGVPTETVHWATAAGIRPGVDSVILGDADAIARLDRELTGLGLRTRRLRVSHAFHSAQLDPVLERFHAEARRIGYRAPGLPVVSNLTGETADPERIASPRYWTEQIRATVRFEQGVRTLREQYGVTAYLELGPHSTLAALTAAIHPEAVQLPVQLRERPPSRALAAALAGAEVHGLPVGGPSGPAPAADPDTVPGHPFAPTVHWLATPGPSGAGPEPAPLPGATTAEREPAEDPAALLRRWADAGPGHRTDLLLALVREQAAESLGYADPARIGERERFQDLGFSSFTVLDLRNRLAAATGLTLPPVVAFDHPTPVELTAHLDHL